MDITTPPIKHFLDSVDLVLNSNTFILHFNVASGNCLVNSFSTFLFSDAFHSQLLAQDKSREWYSMYYLDYKSSSYLPKTGSLLEEKFDLQINKPSVDKREYLIAMLTGDTSFGRFFSFYGEEKTRTLAEVIIDNFTSYLSAYTSEWELYIVTPNFIKSTKKSYPKEEKLKYFEGDFGNDNALIITSGNNAFLVLTNGID